MFKNFQNYGLTPSKRPNNATRRRRTCLFCLHWSHSTGWNRTLCTLVTSGRLVALPIKTWRTVIMDREDMGRKGEDQTKVTFLLQNLSEPCFGFLWDRFFQLFSSQPEEWRKNNWSFHFHLWDKAREKCGFTVNAGETWQCFFSCLRQIIFCKFNVTSVLVSMYYIDSKPTLKCNWRVPDHCIFTLCVCVCVCVCMCVCFYLQVWICVCMCKMVVIWVRQVNEMENTE